MDGCGDVDALYGAAALSAVKDAAVYYFCSGPLDVDVCAYVGGVFAAELEDYGDDSFTG